MTATDPISARAMRRLIVDRIPDDFDTATHVALGPWCFFGREYVFPDWDILTFIDPLSRAEDRCAADRATCALVNDLVDRLWPKMNLRHQTGHGRAYWHAVLADWLLHLVQLSWRLHTHVEAFIAASGDEPFEALVVAAQGRFRFSGCTEFTRDCYRPSDFRSWLTSEIVRRLAPSHWRLSTVRNVAPRTVSAVVPTPRRQRAVENIYGMGHWGRLMSLRARMLRKRAPRPAPPPPKVSVGYFPANFLALVDELVATTVPETFDSGFSAMETDAARHRYRRGQIRATTINADADQDNFILGHAVEAGERIVPVQHGGCYGWAGPMSVQSEMEYCHDTFVTWGWTEQEDYAGRFVPLPSPLLSRGIGKHRPSGEDVVLVGTAMHSLYPRIEFVPAPMEYRQWKRAFITELAPAVGLNLRYRPYPWAETFADGEWLRRFFPDLRIVDGDLHKALFACRLAVIDHPVTTLAVTLSANIPTIAFWNHDAWPLARQAKPFFEELEAAQIVFRDPASAAKQLNAVWTGLEEWWREPARQRARAAWCRQYALADRHWKWRWWTGLAEL